MCFNEAAALHRGKRRYLDGAAREHQPASMRPRHYTAENFGPLLSVVLDILELQ